MFESIKNGLSGAAAAVTTKVSEFDWEKLIPHELFDKWENFTSKMFITIIIAVIVLVLLNTVFDSVRRVIRGLDVSAVGGLFMWISYKLPDFVFIRNLKDPFMKLGVALLVVGIILFIVFKVIGTATKKGKLTKSVGGEESAEAIATKGMNKVVAVILALAVGLGGGIAIDHFVLSKDKTVSIDSITIAEKISEISELATLQNEYTEKQEYTNAKTIRGFKIPFATKTMMLAFNGTIKAGPNMDKVKVTVDEKSQAINVLLPHSKILSHEIDEDSIVLEVEKNGIFNRIKPDNVNEVRKTGKANKEKKVLETDFLMQADKKASDQVYEFLKVAYPQATINVAFF